MSDDWENWGAGLDEDNDADDDGHKEAEPSISTSRSSIDVRGGSFALQATTPSTALPVPAESSRASMKRSCAELADDEKMGEPDEQPPVSRARGKPVPAAPKETRMCNMCQTSLPRTEFPDKGGCCRSCENAKESLQYLLKQHWGKSYRAKFLQLRADKPKYRRQVLAHEMQRIGNAHRQLLPDQERLESATFKRKVRGQRRRPKKNMTYEAFKSYKMDSQHGGYAESQVEQLWAELKKAQAPVDFKGVCSGVTGFVRYKVALSESEASGSESGVEDAHVRGKSGKALDPKDVSDFKDGIGSFDVEVPLPPELAAEEEPKDASSACGGALTTSLPSTECGAACSSSGAASNNPSQRHLETAVGSRFDSRMSAEGEAEDADEANAKPEKSRAGAKWKRAEAVASACVSFSSWRSEMVDESVKVAMQMAEVEVAVVITASQREAVAMKAAVQLFHRRSLVLFAFCAALQETDDHATSERGSQHTARLRELAKKMEQEERTFESRLPFSFL